jgi:hypothetical protein
LRIEAAAGALAGDGADRFALDGRIDDARATEVEFDAVLSNAIAPHDLYGGGTDSRIGAAVGVAGRHVVIAATAGRQETNHQKPKACACPPPCRHREISFF